MATRTATDTNATPQGLFTVLEELGYGIVFMDREGKVTALNAAALGMLQLNEGSIRGTPAAALGEPICTIVRTALKNHTYVRNEDVDYQCADGQKKYLTCSVCRIDGIDRETFLAVIMRDETALVEREFAAERNKRLASIGAMTASIAHDIKNPLVALKTFAELFPVKYAEQDFRETFTKIVLNEIRRIDDMVSRLLDYAHPKKPSCEDVDVGKMINETISLYSIRLAKQQIRLKELHHTDLPKVRGDAGQLRRVFNNLILNAIEAMPGGGILSVSTSRAALRGARAGTAEEALAISIADSGKGISEQAAEKIFEPFFTTKKNGSGLGLTICRKIIEDHRGKIDVKSSSQGTVFCITLPAASACFRRGGAAAPLVDVCRGTDRAFLDRETPWFMAKAVQE
jgi:signal transduction histidine kinase